MATVLYSPRFTPLLGHAWLLTATAIQTFLPQRTELLSAVLERPPWRLFGVAVQPEHPEYGLGWDLWWAQVHQFYAFHTGLMLGVWAVVFCLATTALTCAWLLYAEGRRWCQREQNGE
jgi:hypothetical protein